MTQPAAIDREVERVPAYVDMARLCFELSISERTVDAWVKDGTIPPPIEKRGKRLWKFKTVERWLDGDKPGVQPSADQRAEGITDATRQAAHARR